MSNNSLKVPNTSSKGGVFTDAAIGLLVIFLMFGWPILAVFLMIKGSVEGYKSRQPPAKEPPKKNKNKWKFYVGLAMIVLWVVMGMILAARVM
jgi:hypothetical protein